MYLKVKASGRGGGQTDKQTDKTDGHINTMNRPGLRAGPSENAHKTSEKVPETTSILGHTNAYQVCWKYNPKYIYLLCMQCTKRRLLTKVAWSDSHQAMIVPRPLLVRCTLKSWLKKLCSRYLRLYSRHAYIRTIQ